MWRVREIQLMQTSSWRDFSCQLELDKRAELFTETIENNKKQNSRSRARHEIRKVALEVIRMLKIFNPGRRIKS